MINLKLIRGGSFGVKAIVVVGLVMGLSLISALKTNAAYEAGRIIDDAPFLDSKSMSIADIQNFLVLKGSGLKDMRFTLSCYGSGSQERQWYTAVGATCDTNIPASEIIYYAAQVYGVSPRVILVTMQKEQSLVTATNPTSWQLSQAMGYACPTSGSCSTSSSFSYQIDGGTWALRFHYERARGNLNWWYTSTSWTCGTAKSLYRPNLYPNQNVSFYDTNGVYYATVYIQNSATSSMYCYTPHTYNNPQGLYGRPVYGNTGLYYSGSYNFVYFFELWFGTTSADSSLYSAIVKDTRNGKVYLATSSKLHYIANQDVADAWGISIGSAAEPSSSYFTSRVEGANLGSLAKDRFGNVFVMDGGQRHYVQTSAVAALWGLNIQDAIQADGFVNSAIDGRWLSSCVGIIGGTDSWIGDTSVRHLLQASVAKAWGCNSTTGMQASVSFVGRLQPGGAPGRFVQFQGKRYLVEAGSLWSSSDSNVVSWYNAIGESYFNCSLELCSTLPKKDLNWLAEDTSNGRWYVIEPGKKRYVNNGKIAKAWGFENFGPRSQLSNDLLNTLANGADLGLSAKSTAPVKYYILGGDTKYYIPNQTAIDEWVPDGEAIDTIDSAVLGKYSDGDSLNAPVSKDTNGQYYVLQGGVKYPIESKKVSSWSDSPVNVTVKQAESMDAGTGIGNVVYYEASGQKQYYAILGKKKYQANYNQVKNSWSLDQAIKIKSLTLDRYTLQSTSLSSVVRISGKVYSLSNLKKKELYQYTFDKIDPTKIIDLSNDVFEASTLPPGSSYLVKDTGSSNIWLVTTKGKVLFTSTAQALNLGYISMGQELNQLDTETINLIPNDSTAPSLVIRSPSGSMKLVSFGGGLGFGDADTALAYIGVSGSVLDVSQGIFDSYGFPRNATRLIRDDSGKVYWLEGGKKRWILNGSLLGTQFNGIRQTYLHGTVMTLIPDGSVIN